MNKELKYSLSKFSDAIDKLKKGVDIAKDELQKDGVIQRFEFSFELLWKTTKIFLNSKGIDVKTPKDSLKEAFRLGWLSEEKIFLDMLEDRNRTSHIYDRATAEEIFSRIRDMYMAAISGVLDELKKVE